MKNWQQVAIKMLRFGAAGESDHQRLLRERQLLAGLRHPNIAHLLDGGLAADSTPYLVLEYGDGLPITTSCRRRGVGREGRLRLQNSIVAGNHDLSVGTDPELSPDCSGAVTSWGFNLFGIAESGVCTVTPTGGDLFGTPAAPIDPLLGALASNGGGTETHLPEMNSPVVDAGDPAGCTDQDGTALSSDQRGRNRHVDGLEPDHDATCDMGAVEVENLIEIYNDDFEDGTTGGWSSAVGLVE